MPKKGQQSQNLKASCNKMQSTNRKVCIKKLWDIHIFKKCYCLILKLFHNVPLCYRQLTFVNITIKGPKKTNKKNTLQSSLDSNVLVLFLCYYSWKGKLLSTHGIWILESPNIYCTVDGTKQRISKWQYILWFLNAVVVRSTGNILEGI